MTVPAVNLTLRDEHFATLGRLLFERPGVEAAAYVVCGRSGGEDEGERLLSRDVLPVAPQHYRQRERNRLSIADESFVPVVKRVRADGGALVLAHSHPDGPLAFSPQDDDEEARFFLAVHRRAPGSAHGSLVFTTPETLVGRVWDSTGCTALLGRVTAVGDRLRLLIGGGDFAPIFDRQVRAFGPDVQRVLADLTVGVVGLGGTGSAVFEQLLRLGVGRLLIIDDDRFDGTNVNRVHGSRLSDVGLPKVAIAARTASDVGLSTRVTPIDGSILDASVARRLRGCDVIFGCTDRQLPRLILSRLATRYLIPVIDVGALVDSHNGVIRSVAGRVTTLLPGAACLLCRGQVTPDGLAAEALAPEERHRRAAEGYVRGLDAPAPAVVPFTTVVASLGVAEFLQRLTGYMGARGSTETLLRFDLPLLATNTAAPTAECDCADRSTWGRGDEEPFLGLMWRPEARGQ